MNSPQRTFTALVMAGGTGGHVFPALAVAERLRGADHRVLWLGTRRGLEARVVPAAGIDIRYVNVSGLRGKGPASWLGAPLRLALALIQSLAVIVRVRPQVVLGMGGFVTGPGGVAAWLLRRPLLVHEQNAIPGTTNRLLARIATGVMEAFPGSFAPRFGAEHTGNPVREDIAALPEPRERLARRSGPLRLLVFGGSQGARALNEVVPAAFTRIEQRTHYEVRHQSGAHDLERVRAGYREAATSVELTAFIDDMTDAYRWADLVLCRAGAMTVAELAAAGVASILVPFPYAIDDHQTRNARYLSDAGAALLIAQPDFDAPRLSRLLGELLGARDRLLKMAEAARRLAMPDATRRVAALCAEAAGA